MELVRDGMTQWWDMVCELHGRTSVGVPGSVGAAGTERRGWDAGVEEVGSREEVRAPYRARAGLGFTGGHTAVPAALGRFTSRGAVCWEWK